MIRKIVEWLRVKTGTRRVKTKVTDWKGNRRRKEREREIKRWRVGRGY